MSPAGPYPYIRDLHLLDAARPQELGVAHPELLEISSPLTNRLPQWRRALAGHPDQVFARYVLEGIEHSFRVGFDYTSSLVSATRNMPSAWEHSEVITAYIAAEVLEGRMCGPFPLDRFPDVHLNRMGVVPKGGRWRLITDLSYPEGTSVNDGIRWDLCSLRYTSVEAVATAAQRARSSRSSTSSRHTAWCRSTRPIAPS